MSVAKNKEFYSVYKKKIPVLGQTKNHCGVSEQSLANTLGKRTINRQVPSDLSQAAANTALPYLGQEQFTHSDALSKGEAPFPVNLVTLGNTTGKSS